MSTDFKPWIPTPLRKALSTCSVAGYIFPVEIAERILNDSRLVPFWQWVETTGIPAMVEE